MIIRSKYTYLPNHRIGENLAISIDDGVIRAIDSTSARGDDVIDLGDALLLPGLVNAHTHLELGFAAGKAPPGPGFADWLRRLVVRLRSVTPEDYTRAVVTGLSDSLAAGVTTLGDIARRPAPTRATIADVTVRPAVVSFGEVIAYGTLRDEADTLIHDAVTSDYVSRSLHIGISPHAPYTVEPQIFRQCAEAARQRGLPVCIHAAETLEELRFTDQLDGPLRDFSVELGVWDDDVPPINASPIGLLDRCGALDERTLLAHCNYVSNDDIALIRDRGAHVVYCPRTHAAFGHQQYPLSRLLDAGVNVCLGTDSLASNPDLSVLSEIRFAAKQFPVVAPATLIDMATINGAQALGLGDSDSDYRTGAIAVGRHANLIAIPIDKTRPDGVLESVIGDDVGICFCCVGGRIVTQPK